MGNTNRRASTRTAQPTAQWDEANVLRMISENKLAPKYADRSTSSSKETIECPICFLEFSILNTVHCCKQYICTDCVVQLKGTENKSTCPFCGNAEMHVSLLPMPKKNISNQHTPSKSIVTTDRSSVSSDCDHSSSARSSGSGVASLSYTTPEQEKKLRSYSLDASHSSGGSGSGVATKSDREALERQIREQRLQFDERDMAEAASQSRGSYFHSGYRSGGSGAGGQATYMGRYRMNRTVGGGPSSPNASSQQMASSAPARSATVNRYVGGIEGMLASRGGIGGITSLQQLEDIMLMEAIRLSMQEAAVQQNSSGAEGSSDSPAPSSTAAAPAMSAASQGTTVVGGTSAAGSGAHSPQRSASGAVAAGAGSGGEGVQPQTMQHREVYVSSSDSRESEELGAPNRYHMHYSDGEDQDFRLSGTSDLVYSDHAYPEHDAQQGDGSRSSDVLSDEDEQLRLAMALSLASLRVEQQQQRADVAEGKGNTQNDTGASPTKENATRAPDMVAAEPAAAGASPEPEESNAVVSHLFGAFCLFSHQTAGMDEPAARSALGTGGSADTAESEGPVLKMPANSTTSTDNSST